MHETLNRLITKHFRISKVINVQTLRPNFEKTKKWEKIRGVNIGADFRDYKSGQEGLQTGVALGILIWGKKNFKSGQGYNHLR